MPANRRLLGNLDKALHAARDPARAPQQQAYMKSQMPYLGITAPILHGITKDISRSHPLTTGADWEDTVMRLWRQAKFREERYAALGLLGVRSYRKWLTPYRLDSLEEIIVTGAWWDYVDQVAVNQFGHLLATWPKPLTRLLSRWSSDDNIWKRRTAIIAQLKFKAATDEQLLFALIEPSLGEKEFFLRKAIGWALREYSKTRPRAVIGYVTRNADKLAPLSKREALKVLLKQGVVAAVP